MQGSPSLNNKGKQRPPIDLLVVSREEGNTSPVKPLYSIFPTNPQYIPFHNAVASIFFPIIPISPQYLPLSHTNL